MPRNEWLTAVGLYTRGRIRGSQTRAAGKPWASVALVASVLVSVSCGTSQVNGESVCDLTVASLDGITQQIGPLQSVTTRTTSSTPLSNGSTNDITDEATVQRQLTELAAPPKYISAVGLLGALMDCKNHSKDYIAEEGLWVYSTGSPIACAKYP